MEKGLNVHVHEAITYGRGNIQLLEDSIGNARAVVRVEQDVDTLFHRVNNALVHRLTLSFHRTNFQLLSHLRQNANCLQCCVKALRVRPADVGIDNALLDFLGAHLKPQSYETTMTGELPEDYAILWTHKALCSNVTHLAFQLYGRAPAPDCIIPKLFHVGFVQTCAITTDVEPRPWIGKFIELFEAAEHRTDFLQSVTLLHMRSGRASPLDHNVDSLGEPRRTDAEIPHSDFIKEWKRLMSYKSTVLESTVADLFEFENAKSAKKLEVFVWTIAAVENRVQTALHYAFLLQIVDINYL